MSTTSERITVDPYFHWLDVATTERPPNPYEMLGLPLFENSLQRIQAAAKRKLDALEKRRESADPVVWERVKMELDAAIAALNDSSERAILDADLRRAGRHHASPGNGAGSAAGVEEGAKRAAGLSCVDCGATNGAERKFCFQCGKTLWDQCPQCQTPHPRSEKFCGQCGVNLRQFQVERNAWCQARLDAAQQAQAEYRFDDAQALLREVARLDDPRLDQFAREAKARRESYQGQRKSLEAEAAKKSVDAQACLQQHAVERALCILEEVPERLRTADHAKLLDETRARHRAILSLSGEIRELLAEKKTLELGPPLERLLALKPDHKEARSLAEQLAAKLVESARKRFSRHDLNGALEMLRRIPTTAVNDAARELDQQTREALWRLERCQKATMASRTQLLFVDRTLKSLASHPDAPALHKQWQTWAKATPREAWLAAPDTLEQTAEAAAGSAAGCRVDWIGRSLRLTGASVDVDRTLREHPGRWFVALGLAVQGIGEAAVEVNLMPQDKGSMWGRWSWGRKKSESTTAWGVDIGPSAIKAVQVRWDAKTRLATVEKAVLVEHAAAIDSVVDERQLADRLGQTLREFTAEHPLAGSKICTNISGISTMSRWISLPPIAEKKLDDALQFALKQQVAIPLDELSWDYASLETPPEKKGELTARRVSWVAAKRHVVANRLELWSKLDLKPDVLQSDAVALHNWLRFELAGPAAQGFEPTEPNSVVALLELGSDVANLVFSGPQTMWFRAVGQAGDDITRALVRDFQISRSEAERWKRAPHEAARGPQYAQILAQHFERLIDEWRRTSSQFSNLLPQEHPARLLLVGGAAAQWSLLDAFRTP